MAYGPHPGSHPQSTPMSTSSRPSNVGSNNIADHPANNEYSGGRYYQFEHGHDNAITQPTSGLTDVDVGFPPMRVVPTGEGATVRDMDITHGRAVIGNPGRPQSLPSRPPDSRRRWEPKGRSKQYRADSKSRRSNNRSGPGGSMGYNTY